MSRPTLSVQLYTLREQLAADPAATIERLAGLGITAVEPFGLATAHADLAGPLAEHGISAPTAHGSFLAAPGELDGLEVDGLDAVLDGAAALGVETVFQPVVHEELWAGRDEVAAIAKALNEAAVIAEQKGIAVGYHNHWWELERRVDGAPALEVLADALDDRVRLELDSYWCAVGGVDPVGLLGRLGDRVAAVHLKDGPISHDTAAQLPAGEGAMPVADVLAAAPEARLVIEFDAYAGDLFAGIAASKATVERIEPGA